MPNMQLINLYIQDQLQKRGYSEVTAVEAAKWLDHANILNDSRSRPGLPLRRLLRAGLIVGRHQESNHRWFIDKLRERPEPPRRSG